MKHTVRIDTPNGVHLTADCWGESHLPPVILAHGGGQTRHAWGGTAQALAERGYHAIAYDHRGHGESGWSPDGVYTLDLFAEDLKALTGTLSQPPVVVGASLGGLSAMLAQGEHGEPLFKAVVLVDITPNMNREGAMNILRFMNAHLEEGFESLEQAADVIARYTGRPRKNDVSGLEKNLRYCDDGRYRWHWDPAFLQIKEDHRSSPARMEEAARQLSLPVLLVRGRQSDLVTEEVANAFLELLPHADYVDVDKARHMVAGDRNDIFTNAVLEFLAGLPA